MYFQLVETKCFQPPGSTGCQPAPPYRQRGALHRRPHHRGLRRLLELPNLGRLVDIRRGVGVQVDI